MHYSWAADTNEGKIMRYFKTILVAAASFAVLACGSESAAPPPNSPAKINPPKTPTVTPVKASAADVELSPEELQLKRGKKVYRKCKSCHTTDENGRHRVGPNLYGILDAKIASKSEFAYSKSFKASDIVWTDENLDAFLAKPKDFLPGNRMTFVGLKKEEDRKAIIAYLHKTIK